MTNEATKPVRIVVASAGAIGQAHIKSVVEEPEAELAGIVDTDPKVADEAGALGVAWATDIRTKLKRVRPEGIVIALPNQFHFPAGMTAIEAGLPVLMEKPFVTLAAALQLARRRH